MSNTINPVDQGMQRIGDKLRETTTLRKADVESPVADKKSQSKPDTADTVELTHSAKLLERVEKTLSDVPAVDNARIEAVRADIASGNYSINAEKIAEALLRTEREFGE